MRKTKPKPKINYVSASSAGATARCERLYFYSVNRKYTEGAKRSISIGNQYHANVSKKARKAQKWWLFRLFAWLFSKGKK